MAETGLCHHSGNFSAGVILEDLNLGDLNLGDLNLEEPALSEVEEIRRAQCPAGPGSCIARSTPAALQARHEAWEMRPVRAELPTTFCTSCRTAITI